MMGKRFRMKGGMEGSEERGGRDSMGTRTKGSCHPEGSCLSLFPTRGGRLFCT